MSEARNAVKRVQNVLAGKPGWRQGAMPVGGAWGDWRRNVRKCAIMNQGDLSWCPKEQGRSQSPHSSEEACNERGAKGGREVEA